ncbi:MAG: hypothetical protein R2911_43000 [Caldilineaceae bacterium]
MQQPNDDFDSPWKNAIEWYFEEFMAFFFPVAHEGIDWSMPVEFLDKELQQVVRDAELGRRYADKLAKVFKKDGVEQWVYVHIEVQGGHETGFEQRVYTYNYRLFDRYNQHVASFVVLADASSKWRPNAFQYELWGCEVNFKFPSIKLVDYNDRWLELESGRNPFTTVVMAHLKAQETRRNPKARYDAKFYLIRRLYESGYARDDIVKLFNFIDWVMQLPQELEIDFWRDLEQYEEAHRMEYVTSVERIGIEKGRIEGREEGRIEGQQAGTTRTLLRILEHRLDQKAPEELPQRLQLLPMEQLEQLIDDVLLIESWQAFIQRLPAQDDTDKSQPQ